MLNAGPSRIGTGSLLTRGGGPRQSAGRSRLRWQVAVPVVLVVVLVLAMLPSVPLPQQSALVPVLLTLLCCLDLFSVVLLIGQFRVTGEPRILAVGCAYLFALVMLLARGVSFAAEPGASGWWGGVPAAAAWLWVLWHTGFVILLAGAMVPWPAAAAAPVPLAHRTRLAGRAMAAAALVAVAVGAGLLLLADRLPRLIEGTDTSALVQVTGPVVVPVVGLAAGVTVLAARRRTGPMRWTALAAAASFGDVLLTLSTDARASGAWYAGRSLSILAAGVMVAALLAEFNGIRQRLAVEGERLRGALDRTNELERLQHTLLGHMADGVLMWDRNGEVVASNPAARTLVGLTADQMEGSVLQELACRAFRPDGTPWGTAGLPSETTFATGEPCRDEVLLQSLGGPLRWLSVTTEPVRGPSGSVDHVVSSLTDVTEQHTAAVAGAEARRARRAIIAEVVEQGGPEMVFQPIVELATGRVVGFEALARFPGPSRRGPDEWFADAAEVGLGVELELSAIRAALGQLDRLPPGAHLSVNAGPATVACPALSDLLSGVQPCRVVLELTEHVGVDDYSQLAEALDRLRCLGLRLAVDDAGSGFASLRHILHLAPDVIKLDGALVTGLDGDPARRALAGALLAFGAEIGADVVAEGIESARESAVLQRLGCQLGQGHHLGRPRALPPAPEPDGASSVPGLSGVR
ncbi:EAL domain-containing protein [Modestobacter lapidis]|nr:EAL domain-containing protein [Modestobacter lapidis]